MAVLSKIKASDNVDYNIRDDYSTWGGRNLVSSYIIPGQNQPGSTATVGRCSYVGPYSIKILAAENADTYFSIWSLYELEDNQVYTLSCEVSNLINGSAYNFPLYAQGNPIGAILTINKNGLNYITFTKTSVTDTTVTYNDRIYHKIFMDDSSRTIASGQSTNGIILSKFKLEKGNKPTDWSPAPEEIAKYIGNETIELYG